MPSIDPDVFNDRLQIIRLGKLTKDALTLTFADTGATKRIPLTDEQHSLLANINPTSFTDTYRQSQREFLISLAERDALRILTAASTLNDFDYVLAVEHTLSIGKNPFDSGVFVIGQVGSFNLSDIGSRFLSAVDGRRTVAQIAEHIQQEILRSEDGTSYIRDLAKTTGRPLYAHLTDAAVAVTKGLADTKSGGAYPAADTSV